MATPSSLTKKNSKLQSVHLHTQINKGNGNVKLQVVFKFIQKSKTSWIPLKKDNELLHSHFCKTLIPK
jgi:hypothetical protein